MHGICMGLKRIAESFEDVVVVYPVHMNPRVRSQVYDVLREVRRVHLIEPLDYTAFVWLMNKAYLVLTDSGGIQEEALALGKPVLVLRRKTERPEGIEAGVSKLVGTDPVSIYLEAARLLDDSREYNFMAKRTSPYGDGKAAKRIVDALLDDPISKGQQ